MGLRSAEARLQPAGAAEASDCTISGHQPGAEAQGIHEEQRILGEAQDEHTGSLRRQAFGPGGVEGPELALEINPVDGQGQPKKRGYMVRGKFEGILRPKAGQVSRDP